MNKREKTEYESAEIAVIALTSDVIATSGGANNGFDGEVDDF